MAQTKCFVLADIGDGTAVHIGVFKDLQQLCFAFGAQFLFQHGRVVKVVLQRTLAVIGRYILSPNVLKNLNQLKSGSGGEIQLTDAIAAELTQGNDVYGYRFKGQRFDCGSKSGFLQATVSFGLAREELRDDLRAYLQDIMQGETAAQ